MSVYNYLLVNALSIIESKDTTKSKNYYNVKILNQTLRCFGFGCCSTTSVKSRLSTIFVPDSKPFFIFRDFMSFRQADVPVYSSPDVLILLPNLDFASFSFRAPSLFYFVFLRLPAVSSDCLSCLFAYQMSLLICPA